MTGTEAAPHGRPRRGRPPQIGADDIVATAAGQIDGDWTVASVAAELGVSDAAIYRYFPSKKAILGAVAERILAEIPAPVYDGDWRALLTELGRTIFAVYLRYPSLLDLGRWAGVGTADGLQYLERTYAEVERAGFEPSDVTAVIGVVASLVPEYAAMARRLENAEAPLWDSASYPSLTRVMAAAPTTAEEAFEQALQIAIDGAGQRLTQARRRKTAAPGRAGSAGQDV